MANQPSDRKGPQFAPNRFDVYGLVRPDTACRSRPFGCGECVVIAFARSSKPANASAMRALTQICSSRQQVAISHSQALELVAAEFGYESWNVLAAKIGNSANAGGVAFEYAKPIMR